MRATRPSQIRGNNAIVTRATTPFQRRQGCLRINNSNNAIVMRALTAMPTMVKTLRIDGNNTIMTRAMIQDQQQAARVTMLV
jgi:hypothetical protein